MIHQVLQDYFPFYAKLEEAEKPKFQARVQDFIKGRDFRPRKGFVVDEQAMIIIAAHAIQLTFGLQKYMFPYFNTIIIYPESYFSLITKRYHQGEVNLQGAIVLSFNDLVKGLKDGDGLSIGLHEFAHALYFENFVQKDGEVSLKVLDLQIWMRQAEKVFELRTSKEWPEMIREYAKSNVQEFFAVGVELFYEQPAQMLAELPELYQAFQGLLQWDPINNKAFA